LYLELFSFSQKNQTFVNGMNRISAKESCLRILYVIFLCTATQNNWFLFWAWWFSNVSKKKGEKRSPSFLLLEWNEVLNQIKLKYSRFTLVTLFLAIKPFTLIDFGLLLLVVFCNRIHFCCCCVRCCMKIRKAPFNYSHICIFMLFIVFSLLLNFTLDFILFSTCQ